MVSGAIVTYTRIDSGLISAYKKSTSASRSRSRKI